MKRGGELMWIDMLLVDVNVSRFPFLHSCVPSGDLFLFIETEFFLFSVDFYLMATQVG